MDGGNPPPVHLRPEAFEQVSGQVGDHSSPVHTRGHAILTDGGCSERACCRTAPELPAAQTRGAAALSRQPNEARRSFSPSALSFGLYPPLLASRPHRFEQASSWRKASKADSYSTVACSCCWYVFSPCYCLNSLRAATVREGKAPAKSRPRHEQTPIGPEVVCNGSKDWPGAREHGERREWCGTLRRTLW